MSRRGGVVESRSCSTGYGVVDAMCSPVVHVERMHTGGDTEVHTPGYTRIYRMYGRHLSLKVICCQHAPTQFMCTLKIEDENSYGPSQEPVELNKAILIMNAIALPNGMTLIEQNVGLPSSNYSRDMSNIKVTTAIYKYLVTPPLETDVYDYIDNTIVDKLDNLHQFETIFDDRQETHRLYKLNCVE